jgi:pimeloyl-ACP methyl ester carboxylesterase
VLRAAGPRAVLLGHSSGAIYALEAARRVPIAALILYEPPLHYEGFDAVVDESRAHVVEGRLDDAAGVFFVRQGGMSDSDLAAFRRTPFWPQIAALAPTLVREWDAIFAFEPTVERYSSLSMPTLLLAGSENASNPTFATADFAMSLPDVRTAVLQGQGHTANESAPGLVADRVAEFLGEVAR